MSETIHVFLIGEGTDVWRPVEGQELSAGAFRIDSDVLDPDEVWQHFPGEIVRCEERSGSEGPFRAAVEKVELPDQEQPFLVAYDYGQGGLWALVTATSAGEIQDRYPELKVLSRVPAWMRPSMFNAIRAETYDLQEPPRGLLASLLEARASS